MIGQFRIECPEHMVESVVENKQRGHCRLLKIFVHGTNSSPSPFSNLREGVQSSLPTSLSKVREGLQGEFGFSKLYFKNLLLLIFPES